MNSRTCSGQTELSDPSPTMRQTRVFIEHPLHQGERVVLPASPARHLTQVLRLTVGDPVTLFNGDGYDYACRLVSAERGGTTAVVVEWASEPEPALPLEIHLALGISKGERMDYAIQKAVELGVGRLTPLFTERSQVRLEGARLQRRMEHWQGILIAACEQSGRRRLPELDRALGLEDWLDGEPGARFFLLDPQAESSLTRIEPPAGRIGLLVGPEGGLSPAERELARRRGCQGVRLGPRILRTETAPLAAIAVAQALWGDFSRP